MLLTSVGLVSRTIILNLLPFGMTNLILTIKPKYFMKRITTILSFLMLVCMGAWADVLSGATVGAYFIQETPVMTFGGKTHTITKDASGNVTISPNNSGAFGETSSRFNCTLVIKINVPSTTTAGVLCEMRQGAANTTYSQGLYMIADRKLKTSWQGGGRQSDANATQLTAGDHTIIFTTGESGSAVYVDGTSKLTDSGLKASGVSYKAIYIPAAYASYITEVHFFPSIQSAANITSIASECSNHIYASQQTGESVTVPSGKILVIDSDANLAKFSGASSIVIAYGKTLTLNKADASISLSGSGTALQSNNITTTVTGNLTAITLKATAGTLKYTGVNLSGSTLDGVVLASGGRINLSNTVTIKNLAGNDLTASNYDYVFVSGEAANLILEGTCNFMKKSDGTTDAPYNHIAIGNTSGSITVKSGANVSCGKIWHSDNKTNAPITVESTATLTSSGAINATTITNNGTISATGRLYANTITNNGTITALKLDANTVLGDGSTTTLSGATPFNEGTVTVSGDVTLNLTATTAALNQAITIAAGKTMTIDGDSKTVSLNVVPTFGAGSKINFKNATINYENSIRSLANYTFTTCTAQFVETTDEYKAGGFTITNIPSGVTVKVKKYGTTEYTTETPVGGTVTISHSVGVSGSAAWLDYTFNASTKATNIHDPADQKITNAGNAGITGNDLTIDGTYTTATSYNDDGTLKVMSTPWRNITWPSNYTVAVAGNVPDVENGCLVAFGTLSGGYLAILRGDANNKILLVKGKGSGNAFEVISTMTAANATELSHLVVFTKNGDTFTVYLDGVQKTQVTYSETLGGGLQIGSLHGGIGTTGIANVSGMSDATAKAKVFAKAIRVYDYVISAGQMETLKEEFPYVSFGGEYSRTISSNSNLSATGAWLNKGTQGYVDLPGNTIRDEVTYYPNVEITTTAVSTLTVNAEMDVDNITFEGESTDTLKIESDGTHNIIINGSLTANGPISVKYGETDLSAIPVIIGESGSIKFDFSDYDFSAVTNSTSYSVTGYTSDYDTKVTGVYPSDIYHSYSLDYNGTTNNYNLTVGPTVALRQKQALDLAEPYYKDKKVNAGIGKYTVSLGETSYAEFADFGTAVMSWTTLDDCVEPTITLNTPTAGYYRFKNVETEGYLTATQLSNYYTADKYVYANGSATSASTVIELRNGNDGLYMYNQGYGFGWVVSDKSSGQGVGYITESADKYVNWFPGTAAGQIGFAICLGNGTGNYASYLTQGIYTANEDDEVVAGTDYTADEAQWVVEAATTATVTLNNGGAGTYYATGNWPFDVTVSGADAYTLALDGTGTWLVPTQLTDNKVPANTPVMLKGSNASATLTINTGSAFSTNNTNSLSGTNLAKDFTVTAGATAEYFMGISDGVVGFYHSAVATDGIYTLGANKAYLVENATARGFAINWDEVTGIRSIDNGKQSVKNGAFYDLSGRRVENPQHGMYIVNGRVVVIK